MIVLSVVVVSSIIILKNRKKIRKKTEIKRLEQLEKEKRQREKDGKRILAEQLERKKRQEIQRIESELVKYEKAFDREEYGYIIGSIETLEKKILYKKNSEIFERLNNLIKNSKTKLEEKLTQIKDQLQKSEDYLDHHDFDKAKKTINYSKKLSRSLRLDCLKEEKYIIDFNQKLSRINRLEKNFKVHQTLLKFSEKYPRITLRELADRVKMDQSEVKKIVKIFIKNDIIPAKYDDASNGIEFFIVMKEIDKLLNNFDEWAKKS